MAHMITTEDSLMYVKATERDIPWHGLGNPIDVTASFDEAKEASGITWKVGTVPLAAQFKMPDGSVKNIEVPDNSAIVRLDTNRVLGVVGTRYEPYQNDVMWDFIQEFQQLSGITLETAGSLKHGRTTWVLAKKGEIEAVAGDTLEEYFFFRNSFDGSTPIQVLFTNIRVVCHNTLTAAIRGARNIYTVRHTKSASDRLKDVQHAMGLRFKYQERVRETIAQLVNVKINESIVDDLLKNVLEPVPQKITSAVTVQGDAVVDLAEATDRKIRARENRITLIKDLMESGAGTQIPGVKGTAWGLLNAVYEYADHFKGTRVTKDTTTEETKLVNAMFGKGAEYKQVAFDYLVKLAA